MAQTADDGKLALRFSGGSMSVWAELTPTRKDRVIDLVREAGIDVSDWSNSSRGEAGASVNPKYCYEWVFVQPGKVVVLNLWRSNMEEDNGRIMQRGNFRKDAEGNRGSGGKPAWAMRAERLDRALQAVVAERLPLRVIVNSGIRRRQGDPGAVRSKVIHRQLDPEPWHVADYAPESGGYVLMRGAPHSRFVDQFIIGGTDEAPVVTRDRFGREYVRDRSVRLAVLSRADGRCEHCRTAGFRMPDGSIYIETHHIVPLSEGGPDSVRNVIALCPNHHREAHHGEGRASLRARFQSIVSPLP